jgi:hypothetical protein
MRSRLLVFIAVSLSLSSCSRSTEMPSQPLSWTTGFWFWSEYSEPVQVGSPVDVLFVKAASIRKLDRRFSAEEPYYVYTAVPSELPLAGEYWFVLRFEHQSVPQMDAAPIIARTILRLRETARQRDLKFGGIQLDIDSPTRALPEYADLLRGVRKDLPGDVRISITALLDWFREGTAIAEVVQQVDEFVPQFYDLAHDSSWSKAIAARIDAVKWGPIFNRFRRPYRIGIATFGRAMWIPTEKSVQSPATAARLVFLDDLLPLHLAVDRNFALDTTHNDADELVLTYRAVKPVSVGYTRFDTGDAVRFILPTPNSVRAALKSAKQMRGYVSGVLFFRWPSPNETLVLQPDEASKADLDSETAPSAIQTVDGGCATVTCTDLYLRDSRPFSSTASEYRIRSSHAMEYFLPQDKMPIRMIGRSALDVYLPPYTNRGLTYLGRAVTATPAEFLIEESK